VEAHHIRPDKKRFNNISNNVQVLPHTRQTSPCVLYRHSLGDVTSPSRL